MRLEIEDNKGFKWALRIGMTGGERAMLLMHSHDYRQGRPKHPEPNEYMCLYYYDSDKPNQPVDQRDWSCGACNHKVPIEIQRYYMRVKWGLDTMMFDDEDDVL